MGTYAALIWCGVWTGLALGLLALLFLVCDRLSWRSQWMRRQGSVWKDAINRCKSAHHAPDSP
jgi:heme exporter protein D